MYTCDMPASEGGSPLGFPLSVLVLVFDPWFSNSGFGIGVSEVGRNLILYCKHFI